MGINQPNGVKPKRRECKLRSGVHWARMLKKKAWNEGCLYWLSSEHGTYPVFSTYLRSPVNFSSTSDLLKYYWLVTSRWGSVLKMDPSVSSETLIGVELYNITSQKIIFFIFTATSTSNRKLSISSSPDVGDQLSYRRGWVVVDGPACVTQHRCWKNTNMKATIKWPHEAVFPFICSDQPPQLSLRFMRLSSIPLPLPISTPSQTVFCHF